MDGIYGTNTMFSPQFLGFFSNLSGYVDGLNKLVLKEIPNLLEFCTVQRFSSFSDAPDLGDGGCRSV